jgi:hypothetical protein
LYRNLRDSVALVRHSYGNLRDSIASGYRFTPYVW